jgi:3-oxoacyl-[acyl-carrier protein] reductase
MPDLTGKTVLITGSSRGIGRAIAARMARDGAEVVVHYGTNRSAGQRAVDAIQDAGGQAWLVGAELGTPGDAERLVAAVESVLDARRLDVLVNNAAIGSSGPLERETPEGFDALFAVNVKAPFFLVQHALRLIPDGGRIINISSGVTRIASPETIAYSATKGAVNVFTHTLAQALGARGITVNAIAPGIVTTDNTSWLTDPNAAAAAARYSVFDRVGDPADIADIAAFLASDQARWITGQIIDATGGSFLGVNQLTS